MPSTPRRAALADFAAAHLGVLNAAPVPASADASFRSYWRVFRDGQSFIVMDAPPDKEDLAAFINVAARLRNAGLNAPTVLAEDHTLGFLLLGDLGTRTFLPELDDASVDALYGDALDALARMQTQVLADGLPVYDEARLRTEMELFPTWFLELHLGHRITDDEHALIESTLAALVASALEQPQAFVHRDYHSRNLMIVPGANPGIIDFQDAVRGPICYDLVSLLKDCYIRWPADRVAQWAEQHRQRLAASAGFAIDAADWQCWFDWIGVQRHLKVLGIFARLNYRDGKPGYLKDLPLVLEYTLEACARYPELARFGEWLAQITDGVDLTTPQT